MVEETVPVSKYRRRFPLFGLAGLPVGRWVITIFLHPFPASLTTTVLFVPVFVDTEEALVKSGDLLGPLRRGALREDDVRGTLGTLCKGVATGRKSDSERTVFKSVGTALEDLAAAVMVLQARTSA